MNNSLLEALAKYLNERACAVTTEDVHSLSHDCDIDDSRAMSLLLAANLGLDIVDRAEDRRLYNSYFPHMLHALSADEYRANPYYANIVFPTDTRGEWQYKRMTYAPYECFVLDDPIVTADGRVIPQIGYFTQKFSYPAVTEHGREWMTVTPNEINTMRAPVEHARGRVLTYGLGLGYFAYMTSSKADVTAVTIVEHDKRAIELFQAHILPQLPCSSKVNVVCADAFWYAEQCMPTAEYDFVFVDLWHDPSDGIDMYLRMKEYEKLCPTTTFEYWIEKTIQLYL